MVCGEPSAVLYTYLALAELSDVQHLVELEAAVKSRVPAPRYWVVPKYGVVLH